MENKTLFENMFGFLSKKKIYDEPTEKELSNQIATDEHDGATVVYGDTLAAEMMGIDLNFRPTTAVGLIDSYRECAEYSEVDFAIQDIINEMVSFTEDDDPVTINLDEVEISDNLKNKIFESWEKIVRIMKLSDTIHHRARRFYIDGRLSYHKVVDKKNIKQGLQNIIELDPKNITKVRNIDYNQEDQTIKSIKEWYVYNENPVTSVDKTHQDSELIHQVTLNGNKPFKTALKLDPASITYVTSGMVDRKTGEAISWLDKAVRPTNQLRMLENALLIYRIVRAPERRAFYIDTGNMHPSRSKQFVQDIKNNYRNNMAFDPETGSFKDKRHVLSMQEDYWLPRQNGRGTEISTIGGGSDLGQINDVDYFLRRLYKALNIPVTRLEADAMVALGGRSAEISRDELKFSKFVSSVRKRFTIMFRDLLRTEMLLKNVFTAKEWDDIEYKIQFIYAQDMYLEERKWFEMTRDRLDLAKEMEQFVGGYYSHQYIRQEILKQSEEEIKEEDKQIKKEKSEGEYDDESEESYGGYEGSSGSSRGIGEPISKTKTDTGADTQQDSTSTTMSSVQVKTVEL